MLGRPEANKTLKTFLKIPGVNFVCQSGSQLLPFVHVWATGW